MFDQPVVLCVLIFLARVTDVSLGTVRTILVFRGHRYVAASLGFIEVLIWLLAAAKVIQNLDRWYYAIAYAGGFAAGNIAGMWVETKLALGTELIRAVSRNLEVDLAEHLRDHGYSVTELPGRNERDEPIEVLLVVEKRRRVPALIERILEADPEAICTISDVKRHEVLPRRRGAFSPTGWRARGKRK